jgi:Putative prokaryotic signal transducing protein
VSDALVTVRRFLLLPEAQLAQGALEGGGIESVIQDENLSRLYGNVTGGVRLQVAAADLERAQELLADLAEHPAEEPE